MRRRSLRRSLLWWTSSSTPPEPAAVMAFLTSITPGTTSDDLSGASWSPSEQVSLGSFWRRHDLEALPELLALFAGNHSALLSFFGEHPAVTVGFPPKSFSDAVLDVLVSSLQNTSNWIFCLKSQAFTVPQPFRNYTELQTSCDYTWVWFRHQENYNHLFLPWNIIDIVDIHVFNFADDIMRISYGRARQHHIDGIVQDCSNSYC